MNTRDQLNQYLQGLEKRMRWLAVSRGAAVAAGVALGAILLAILETSGINVPLPVYWHGWSFHYLPPSYQQVIPFALLVVVLLILPKGLSSLFNRKWKAA